MQIQFSKMHGLGNDFVVIDNVTQNVFFSQCGNGARCFARFVKMKGLTNRNKIVVSTKSGRIVLYLEKDGQVTVNMGVPEFEPNLVPIKANKREKIYILRAQEQTFFCGAVSMGNPHCVLLVDDVQTADVETMGPLLEKHERCSEGANVGFMQIINPSHIKLRVFERGVGETLACGSGACAAVAVGQLQNRLSKDVRVDLPGGSLKIRWQGNDNILKMTGAAEHIFDGYINL